MEYDATAPYETIQVRQLSPTVGAEISGVDLLKDVSDGQFTEIRRALDENLAVVFRGQVLTVRIRSGSPGNSAKRCIGMNLGLRASTGMAHSILKCWPGRRPGIRGSHPATAGTRTYPATPVRSRSRCCM